MLKGSMARTGMALGVAVAITKLLLLACAWACMAAFLAWLASSVTWRYDDPFKVWERLRAVLVVKYGLVDNVNLLSGFDPVYLIFSFLTLLAAAIFVAIAYTLPSKGSSGLVRRLLTWQLPLRRVWLSWCGGLSLGEWVMWSGWLVLHIVALRDITRRRLGNAVKFWNDMGMRTHVPHSVIILEEISLAFAFILFIDITLVFLPISRNSFLNRMLGMPYAGLIRFHRWVGHFVLVCLTGHGLFYYAFWIADPTINFWRAFFDWNDMYSMPALAGSIALLGGLLIWVTSLEWVRRNYFKVFYRSHIIGFLLFTVFGFVHYHRSWWAFFPGLFLYSADLVVRSFYSHKGAHISGLRRCGTALHMDIMLPPKTFREPLSLLGSHLFVRVPVLSRLDWHPFTVADVNVNAASFVTLSMVIKSYGSWTKRLHHLAAELESGTAPQAHQSLLVNIWQPTDRLDVKWQDYNHILMVAGGIAVTPVAALLRSMLAQVHAGVAPPQRLRLMMVSRSRDEFSGLGADLLQACRQYGWIHPTLHYTGSGSLQRYEPETSTAFKPTAIAMLLVAASKGSADLSLPDSNTSRSASTSGDGSSSSMNGKGAGAAPPPALAAAGMSTMGSVDLSVSSPGSGSYGGRSKLWSVLGRALPVDFLTEWQAIWAVVLAFFGGFMGIILALAGGIEVSAAGATRAEMGALYLAVISVNCVGFPALFIIMPIYVNRQYLFITRRGRPTDTPHVSSNVSSPTTTVDAYGRLSCDELGVSMDIHTGRPDLAAEVQAWAQQAREEGGGRALVVSSGPLPMMHAISLAVSCFNDSAACGGFHLKQHEVAFDM